MFQSTLNRNNFRLTSNYRFVWFCQENNNFDFHTVSLPSCKCVCHKHIAWSTDSSALSQVKGIPSCSFKANNISQKIPPVLEWIDERVFWRFFFVWSIAPLPVAINKLFWLTSPPSTEEKLIICIHLWEPLIQKHTVLYYICDNININRNDFAFDVDDYDYDYDDDADADAEDDNDGNSELQIKIIWISELWKCLNFKVNLNIFGYTKLMAKTMSTHVR